MSVGIESTPLEPEFELEVWHVRITCGSEKQVGLGESTCSGRFTGDGSGFMDIVSLGQLALERANTSRRAVLIMGALAETHGYNDQAESLLVTDPREAWIFQILPVDEGIGALWVAQRLPDDHVGAVMNGFTVRAVDLTDETRFLWSANLATIARQDGLWNETEPLDFTRIFARGGVGQPPAGPQYHVGRRMWRLYSLLAPEAAVRLPTHYDDYVIDAPYPASLPAKRRSVSLLAVQAAMRDFYSGTPLCVTHSRSGPRAHTLPSPSPQPQPCLEPAWNVDLPRSDLTKGMAAGPFGTPDRFGGPSAGQSAVPGGWERSIATHRSYCSLVVESRAWLPDEIGGTLWCVAVSRVMHSPAYLHALARAERAHRVWNRFAPHAAHTSTYAPLPCGIDELPASYSDTTSTRVDRRLAVWANRFVFNVAQLKFVDVFPQVDAARRGLDNASLALQAEADAQYVAGASMSAISASFRGHADAIVAAWWRLFEELMLRHGDGRGPSGYPAWWLRSDDVGYTSGPRSDRALMASAKPPEGHADGPELCLASRCGLSGSTGQQVDAACVLSCLRGRG